MSKPAFIQAEKLIGSKVYPEPTTITDKDAIIYALGVGFSTGTLLRIQIHCESKISSILMNSMLISLFFPQWELLFPKLIVFHLCSRALTCPNLVLLLFSMLNKNWPWLKTSYRLEPNSNINVSSLILLTKEKMLFSFLESTLTAEIKKDRNN